MFVHPQKGVGREATADAVTLVNPAPKIIQTQQLALVATTSTTLATILGEAINAEAAAVLIINNTASSILRIKQDGTDADANDADIGASTIKLTGVKADFDDVRLFSAGTPLISVIVFGYRIQT